MLRHANHLDIWYDLDEICQNKPVEQCPDTPARLSRIGVHFQLK